MGDMNTEKGGEPCFPGKGGGGKCAHLSEHSMKSQTPLGEMVKRATKTHKRWRREKRQEG